MLKAWRASRDDGIASIITFVATLAFSPNIQNGILIGIILSLALLMYRMMRPRIALLGLQQDGTLVEEENHNLSQLHSRLGVIRFDGALRFINVSSFEKALLKLEKDKPEIQTILVKCSGINEIDASGVDTLSKLIIRFKANGTPLCFSEFKKQVLDVIDRTGLGELIGRENLFTNDQAAIDALLQRLREL